MNEIKNKRVAIVHDWLTVYGGAEVVLSHIINLFSNVDLFCILKDDRNEILKNKNPISIEKLQKQLEGRVALSTR